MNRPDNSDGKGGRSNNISHTHNEPRNVSSKNNKPVSGGGRRRAANVINANDNGITKAPSASNNNDAGNDITLCQSANANSATADNKPPSATPGNIAPPLPRTTMLPAANVAATNNASKSPTNFVPLSIFAASPTPSPPLVINTAAPTATASAASQVCMAMRSPKKIRAPAAASNGDTANSINVFAAYVRAMDIGKQTNPAPKHNAYKTIGRGRIPRRAPGNNAHAVPTTSATSAARPATIADSAAPCCAKRRNSSASGDNTKNAENAQRQARRVRRARKKILHPPKAPSRPRFKMSAGSKARFNSRCNFATGGDNFGKRFRSPQSRARNKVKCPPHSRAVCSATSRLPRNQRIAPRHSIIVSDSFATVDNGGHAIRHKFSPSTPSTPSAKNGWRCSRMDSQNDTASSSFNNSPPDSFAARTADDSAPEKRRRNSPPNQALAVIGTPADSIRFVFSIAADAFNCSATVFSHSGFGTARKVASVIAPSVPIAPTVKRETSKPATFFITRPPKRNGSPLPSTIATPRMWSRTAPANGRRGPDKPQATVPPTVASAPKRGGSNASACSRSDNADSTSAKVVPAFAQTNNSLGS